MVVVVGSLGVMVEVAVVMVVVVGVVGGKEGMRGELLQCGMQPILFPHGDIQVGHTQKWLDRLTARRPLGTGTTCCAVLQCHGDGEHVSVGLLCHSDV